MALCCFNCVLHDKESQRKRGELTLTAGFDLAAASKSQHWIRRERIWVHVDVMDGNFAPNISMGPFIVETCRRMTRLPLDVPLMITDPDRYVEAFVTAGAQVLTVHVEACPHLYRTLQAIRQLGRRPGVAGLSATPLSAIEKALPLVDFVLILGTNPGFSGQKFIPDMMGKIARLRGMLDRVNSAALIQVDGSKTIETLPLAYRAGARMFVAGNAVFMHPQEIAAGARALQAQWQP